MFWGSQSGTAEGFANRLAREISQRFSLAAISADLSDYDPDSIRLIPQSKLAIFLLSTYGEGDPSDNANQFWNWATNLEGQPLNAVRYAAFGLGSRNYQHYNRVVDVVDTALQGSGAHRLMPVGKADDAGGTTEEDFLQWKTDLFALFERDSSIEVKQIKYSATIEAVYDTSLDLIDLHNGEPVPPPAKNQNTSPTRAVTVTKSRELFTSSKRNCLHMELSLDDAPNLVYKTGDHIGLWAMNPDLEIERLTRVLGLGEQMDTPLSITAVEAGTKVQVPSPTTIAALFRYYVDICAAVSREIICTVAEFAPSTAAKDWLLKLGNDKETYAEFVERTHINFGRLLEMASGQADGSIWSDIPLTYVIENLPIIRPRYYSISSSSVLSPRNVSVTALVANSTLLDAQRTTIPGLTTNYLLALSRAHHGVSPPINESPTSSYDLSGPSKALDGGKSYAFIRRSTFRLPTSSSRPLIMLAAGTGIAPFRAFIAERAHLMSVGKEVGEMVLFFGCRHPDEDYIYREELESAVKSLKGKLTLLTAFSRHGTSKVYIQDKLRERSDMVTRLVDEDAALYSCGRASMARDAATTVALIVGKSKGWNEEQSQQWLSSMKRSRQWQEDVWG